MYDDQLDSRSTPEDYAGTIATQDQAVFAMGYAKHKFKTAVRTH